MDTQKITPEMTIAEIIKIKPEAIAILREHGMHCIGCSVSRSESLRDAVEVHGIELTKLVEKLNG
ncbi:MAG: DUF1858 domain-containing protein [Candidatus Riflebacteria bacterium]|nr:DUF1858 domain-containing protein [Candidatus Riflebacteria bacterium]